MISSGQYLGFPGSAAGKESACNAGDLGSIPGSRRSCGEGIGYPLQDSWASLAVQMVKNPTRNAGEPDLIPELGTSPRGGHGNPLQYSCLENPHGQRSLVGYSPESDMTERLSTAQHQPILTQLHQTLKTITTALCQLQPIKPGSDLIFWTQSSLNSRFPTVFSPE